MRVDRHPVLRHLFARLNLTAERRDLDYLLSELDVCQAEAAADDPAVPKELLDLLRVRRRADVEVFRFAAEEQIADAAANQVGGVLAVT